MTVQSASGVDYAGFGDLSRFDAVQRQGDRRLPGNDLPTMRDRRRMDMGGMIKIELLIIDIPIMPGWESALLSPLIPMG